MTIEEKIRNSDKEKIVLYAIVCMGIIIRLFMAYWHFTHVDDVGVLVQYLSQDQAKNEIEAGRIIANSWTYAPLQGIFTSLLVNKVFPYRLNVFMGRLPSCLLGIISLFLVLKNSRFLCKDKRMYFMAFGCALLSFSWENIIYSAQTEPYEIVVFFGLLLILSAFQKFYENWKMTLLYLVVFTLGCYGHYQFFILIFCYYAALFLCNLKNKNNLIRICTVSLANLLMTLPLICFFIVANRMANGINWNRGLGDQFLLTLSSSHIINNFRHFLKFFAYNTFYLYKYFFTVDTFNIVSSIFAALLMFLAIVGFFFVHKKNMILGIFSDFLILITVVLVVMQKLTFGPSRHCLYIYPMLLMFLCYGVLCFFDLCNKFGQQKIFASALKATTAFLFISFLFSLPREVGNRKNFWTEEYVNNLIAEYSPEYIYNADWSCEFRIMDLKNCDVVYCPPGGAYYWRTVLKNNSLENKKHRYLIVNRMISLNSVFDAGFFISDFEKITDDFRNEKKSIFDVVFKKELFIETEIEYAQKYWNWGNGLHIYVLDCKS